MGRIKADAKFCSNDTSNKKKQIFDSQELQFGHGGRWVPGVRGGRGGRSRVRHLRDQAGPGVRGDLGVRTRPWDPRVRGRRADLKDREDRGIQRRQMRL